MKRRGGVTLVELMVTLGTLSVALALIAGLVSQYQRLLFRDSSQSLIAAQFQQVNLLRCDLAQATSLLAPTAGTVSDQVRFTRVDPLAARLDSVPTPGAWNPMSTALSLNVRYYLDAQQQLRRATDKAGLARSDQVVLRCVSGFSARRTDTGTMVLSLAFLERDVVRNLECEVYPCVH